MTLADDPSEASVFDREEAPLRAGHPQPEGLTYRLSSRFLVIILVSLALWAMLIGGALALWSILRPLIGRLLAI
jgi:hypothetical protein